MGQYPGLEDFYRYERNEYKAYTLVNVWKKTIQSVIIISGIVLSFRILCAIYGTCGLVRSPAETSEK